MTSSNNSASKTAVLASWLLSNNQDEFPTIKRKKKPKTILTTKQKLGRKKSKLAHQSRIKNRK